VRVAIGRQVQLRGRGLKVGLRVTFRWPAGALATKLRRTRAGLVVRVPPGTRPGRVAVTVRDRAGRRSNARHVVVEPVPARLRQADVAGTLPAAFAGDGMWIWQLARTEGGDLDAIAARAAAARIRTVFVKSSDGTTPWAQFTPALVEALHARGLRACAWQFVYGAAPAGEAAQGAAAVADGADCLVVDAESAYNGRYAEAQAFMTQLRGAVGPAFPVGLTSFPYVDFHPRLPYSVFLRAGGAQASLPQVYWKDIGDTVDAASAHTVAHNRIYGVPLAPIGQAYTAPRPEDLRRFRALWAGYGAGGLSWWSWQAASPATWATLTEPPPAAVLPPDPGWPALARGRSGDQVIWLQEHLVSADPALVVDGRFGAPTEAALRGVQSARGLPATGVTDPATWQAVLALVHRPRDWAAATPTAARARAGRAARRTG
jgi:hypothetical protein